MLNFSKSTCRETDGKIVIFTLRHGNYGCMYSLTNQLFIINPLIQYYRVLRILQEHNCCLISTDNYAGDEVLAKENWSPKHKLSAAVYSKAAII